MTYLLDSFRFQSNPQLYKLEGLEKTIKSSIYMLRIKNLDSSQKSAILKNLKNSEKDINNFGQSIKGINWYAFMFGFSVYYMQHLLRNKVLLNEMNYKALPHILICTAVGLAFGASLGYSTASNFKLYRKFKSISTNFKNLKIDSL